MRLRALLREERGTTLPELMVGLSTGLLVLLGISTLVIVTLHATARVSARVDATQRGRVVMTRILDQVHSACIAPKVPPIRKGSTDTSLQFIHSYGSQVAPVPTLTVMSLSGTTLFQTDYALKEGSPPFWVFNTTPTSTTQVMQHVSPIPTRPVFSYYAAANGAVAPTPLPVPLSELDASRAIQVSVAFMTSPMKGPNNEEAAPARYQGSATFRLTAPSFNKEAASLPCQ